MLLYPASFAGAEDMGTDVVSDETADAVHTPDDAASADYYEEDVSGYEDEVITEIPGDLQGEGFYACDEGLAGMFVSGNASDMFVSGETADESVTDAQLFSAAGNYQIAVSKEEIGDKGAVNAIQEALDLARAGASAAVPYTITVEPGTYDLEGTLFIYSNTTLILTDVTLVRTARANMLRVGGQDASNIGVTGYYYKNIAVEGGVFDGNNIRGTMLKVGHTSNFSMNGVTAKNAYNDHIMETAGVDGLYITNCCFLNQQMDSGASVICYEAIQLDILYSQHIVGYRSEDLTTRNVIIDHCDFTDVPRGVGSHSGVLNNPVTGVTITNCHFSNISSAAIQGLNWVDCNISDNTINGAPRGIVVYAMRPMGEGMYNASDLYLEGNLSCSSAQAGYSSSLADQNIYITNNEIVMNDTTDPYASYQRLGILVSGNAVEGARIPDGDYYASGAVVKNNRIYGATGHGIRFIDTRNSVIESNVITGAETSDGNCYGIQIRDRSTGNRISGNQITNMNSTGIFVAADSAAVSVDSNTIRKAGKYGIDVENSHVDVISDNQISVTDSDGIFVYRGSTVNSIVNNAITGAGLNGIRIHGSTADTIKNNQIINAAGYGIVYTSASKGKLITKNTVRNVKLEAISADKTSSVVKNDDNYILETPVLSSVTCTNSGLAITWRKVSGAAGYRVYRKTASSGWSRIAAVSGTNYTDSTAVPGNMYYYTVRALKNGALSSDFDRTGLCFVYLSTPVLSKASNVNNGIKITWKGTAGATGYRIYRKTQSSGWRRIKDVTSTAYVDTAAVSGSTCYYTVRALYNGVVSSGFQAKGLGCTYLSMPKVSVSNGTLGITVKWNKVAGAAGYRVYRKTLHGSYKRIASISASGRLVYVDKEVKNSNGTGYIYTVRAYKDSSLSAFTGKVIYRRS